MKSLFRDLWFGEGGQDLVEYALLAALIAVVSVAALNTLGGTVSSFYTRLRETLSAAA